MEYTVTDTQTIYMFQDGTYFHYEKESDGSYICKYVVKDDEENMSNVLSPQKLSSEKILISRW